MVLDDNIKTEIIQKINDILNLDYFSWSKLDKNIKLKYIHRLCSFLEKDDNLNVLDTIFIPLKSLKPKKIIQYCGFSNQSNKELYIQFNKLILNYTIDFRNKYLNISKQKYYTYSSLPKNEYNDILNNINQIVYYFITKNKINIEKLLASIIGSNNNKLIITENNNYNISFHENIIEIITSNFNILLTLVFRSNTITNNIPVIYHIKLNNLV
jgi:hypothetical protein